MARTEIARTDAPGWWMTAGVVLVWVAADVANQNKMASSADEIILVRNTDSASHTFSLNAQPDSYGRSTIGNISDTLAAGEYRVYGPIRYEQWVIEASGYIELGADSNTVQMCCIWLNRWAFGV